MHLFQESCLAGCDGLVQTGPEFVVARPLDVFFGLHVVGRGVQAFGEQPQPAGSGECLFAGLDAADVEVLVPSHVDRESAFLFQSAPGAVVAQHGAHQLQPDIERHLRPVVKAGWVGREESVQPKAVHRRLYAEVCQGRDLRFPYDQVIDAGVPGEGRDRLKVGRLDLTVVAEDVLGAGVVTVFVAVGGVVLGDAVDVGELHLSIIQHTPATPARKCHGS